MSKLLKKAFELAAALPEAEQDALGTAIIAELEAERRWDRLFAASGESVDRLAEEALAEFRRNRTKPMDTVGGE